MRTRPRAIPLAMITMRKSIHGFPLVSYMGMGLCLAVLWTAGAPLSMTTGEFHVGDKSGMDSHPSRWRGREAGGGGGGVGGNQYYQSPHLATET